MVTTEIPKLETTEEKSLAIGRIKNYASAQARDYILKKSGYSVQGNIVRRAFSDKNEETYVYLEGSEEYGGSDEQTYYNQLFDYLSGSGLWEEATDEQKIKGEEAAYDIASGNTDGISYQKSAEEMGISDEDYVRYKLALQIVDTPNANGQLGGNPTMEEEKAALLRIFDRKEAMQAFWKLHPAQRP